MKVKLVLCLALLPCFIFTGCVNDREFRGTISNLRGNGDVTSGDKPLKFRLSSSGNTINGGEYMALSLPQEKCQVILFYPKGKPFSYYYFRADIETNRMHVRQIEEVWRGTNDVGTNFDLPAGQTAVWLVRGKPLRRSVIKLGSPCPTNIEPLFGKLEVMKDGDFRIDAKLSNDDGTKISGTFDSYRGLCAPIAEPIDVFLLMFGLVNE